MRLGKWRCPLLMHPPVLITHLHSSNIRTWVGVSGSYTDRCTDGSSTCNSTSVRHLPEELRSLEIRTQEDYGRTVAAKCELTRTRAVQAVY
jgi:hypothetical protein